MPNRREFLQTGAAVSAFAMNGLIARDVGAVNAAPAGVAPHKAIYDDRYAEAREFAAAVSMHGVPIRALEDGDVTRFWYDELDLLWKTRPAAIAGTTQFGPMFVLERLGAERGLRMALRVEHRREASSTLAHVVTAEADTVALARELCNAGFDWPVLMAALACRCGTPSGAGLDSVVLAMRSSAPELSSAVAARAVGQASVIHYYAPRAVQQGYGVDVDGPLYSWVIAPPGPELTMNTDRG